MPFPMAYILFLAGILTFLPTGKQELGQLKTEVWRAAFLAGIIDMLVVIIQILVFGPEETIRLIFGLLVLGKMVEISRTVAGIESLFMGIWFGAMVIKCCAFFFMTTWGIETMFNFRGLKWRLAVSAVFWGIASGIIRADSLSTELSFVESYLISPFAFIWIPTLWGVWRWKQQYDSK